MAKNDEKYAYLNRLSTEQLEELLRMDMEMAEPGNEDVVFHILEVIEQREDEHPTGRIPDVDKAWAEFHIFSFRRSGPLRGTGTSEYHADFRCCPAQLSYRRRERGGQRRTVRTGAAVEGIDWLVPAQERTLIE